MSIYNLTQHNPLPAQVEAGVVNLPTALWAEIKDLSTFVEKPTQKILKQKAMQIAKKVNEWLLSQGAISYDGQSGFLLTGATVMIGGAPYFMSHLENALKYYQIKYTYAFSQRKSIETQIDGKTVKQVVFEFLGFI